MFGIIIGAIISIIALLFAIGVSAREIKGIKKRKFTCPNCEKEFSPKGSVSSLLNFGDNSKVAKCPHCGHQSRMAHYE